jgi:hypothetical protein
MPIFAQNFKRMKLQPFLPALIWGIFIFGLSVWPGKDFPKLDWGDLLSLDKIVHISFYALLTYLILRGGKLQHLVAFSSKIAPIAVATFSTVYGWGLEWIQENFCQDRLFDVLDGVANTIGAFGVAAFYFFQNIKNQ